MVETGVDAVDEEAAEEVSVLASSVEVSLLPHAIRENRKVARKQCCRMREHFMMVDFFGCEWWGRESYRRV